MKHTISNRDILRQELLEYVLPLSKSVTVLLVDIFILNVLFGRIVEASSEVGSPIDLIAGVLYFFLITIPHLATFLNRLHGR